MQVRNALRPLAGLAICALVLAGCANGEEEAVVGNGNDEPSVVEVELDDYEFKGLPSSVESGTRFTVTNSSEAELHELVAFRIPDEEDRSLDELVQLPPEEFQAALGGPPVFVLLAAPGGPQIDAVGDGTVTEPGRYAFLCFIPTGADPDEFLQAVEEMDEDAEGPPEVDGGPPHLAHGMYAEVTVE